VGETSDFVARMFGRSVKVDERHTDGFAAGEPDIAN
jgi:hypothetical protein